MKRAMQNEKRGWPDTAFLAEHNGLLDDMLRRTPARKNSPANR
jgi:hypothetical protein